MCFQISFLGCLFKWLFPSVSESHFLSLFFFQRTSHFGVPLDFWPLENFPNSREDPGPHVVLLFCPPPQTLCFPRWPHDRPLPSLFPPLTVSLGICCPEHHLCRKKGFLSFSLEHFSLSIFMDLEITAPVPREWTSYLPHIIQQFFILFPVNSSKITREKAIQLVLSGREREKIVTTHAHTFTCPQSSFCTRMALPSYTCADKLFC